MLILPRFRLFRSRFQGVFDPTRDLAAFLSRFGESLPTVVTSSAVLDVYAARPDLRDAFPLGLTPQQWEGFATWLMEHGRRELGITTGEVVAWLRQTAKDPSLGLVETWLLSPTLQEAVLNALTETGWPRLKREVARRWNVSQRWLSRANLVGRAEALRSPTGHITGPAKRAEMYPAQPTSGFAKPQPDLQEFGVNILAHFRYPSGLQEEALQYVAAIRALGGAVSLRDAPLSFTRRTVDENLLGSECYPITLAKLGACESFDDQYPRCGWHPRPGVHRIAAISWELSTLPRGLAGRCDLADELWTPSEFCAAAVKAAFPEKIVTPMLPAVSLPSFTPLPRSHFGLPENRFLFYFAFDIGSVMERKNPLGLVRAFQSAFRSDDRVHLAIKVTRGSSRPDDLAMLKAAAQDVNATVIDAVFPRDELAALLNCCDAYVSLHRAEGFGYTIAEAMMMGKPTLATNYSANTEFMTPATAIGIDYELVPIGGGCEPYPGDAMWAEPDEAHAAAMMRWVYQHKEEARALGTRAREELSILLSPLTAGQRMMKRFTAIKATAAARRTRPA